MHIIKSGTCSGWYASIAILIGGLAYDAKCQSDSSLTEREIETSEARTALTAVIRDNAKLKKQIQEAQVTIAGLQNNLMISSTEGEVLKRQASELKLRLEALSIGGGQTDSSIESRLLKAVATLREAETQRNELIAALDNLVAAVDAFRKSTSTGDAESTLAVETAMRAAKKARGITDNGSEKPLEKSPVAPASANEGKVMATKEELALIVANIGRNEGVRIGMPFRVVRDDKQIATVRVVDVRDRICGAVVQDLSSENTRIQVGDRLIIGAEHSL